MWGTAIRSGSPSSTHKPTLPAYSPGKSSDRSESETPKLGVGGTPNCPKGVHHKALQQIEKIVCIETLETYQPINDRLLEFLDHCDTRCLAQAELPAQRMWAIITCTYRMLEMGKITAPRHVVHMRHTLRVWADTISLDLEKNRWTDDGSAADNANWEEIREKLSMKTILLD